HPPALAFDPEATVLQVRHEPALGLVVGVRDVMADHRRLAGHLTHTCHGILPKDGRYFAKPRILRESRPASQSGGWRRPNGVEGVKRGPQMRPRSANDTVLPGPATMMWSKTRTSTSASASRNVRVSSSSARLGSAAPDGWLWARITAAALKRRAS